MYFAKNRLLSPWPSLLLLLAMGLAVRGTWRAALAEESGVAERWALLVGIDDYSAAVKLRFCGADQRALRDQLVASGFPADHVFTLTDQAPNQQASDTKLLPTKENIERRLKDVVAGARSGDFVVFGFSGHGLQIDGKSYLCPIDGKLDDPTTLISVDQVFDRLGECPARLKLVFVDACRADPRLEAPHSTKPNESTRALAKDLQARKLPPGVCLFQSCSPGEVSWDDTEAKQSVFMSFILQGLRGAADSQKDGQLSLSELQSYIGPRTKARVLQRHNLMQRPIYRSAGLPNAAQIAPLVPVFAGVPPVVTATTAATANPGGAKPKGAFVPASLAGRRDGELKRRLVREMGGTEQTEKAVELGLRWLAAHQLPDGMWSLTGTADQGVGAYDAGAKFENKEAATAMALLALLGSGHSPTSGTVYAPVTSKGLKALLRSQDKKGDFFRGSKAHDWMYSQAICTLALCECLGMEPDDESLRTACESAVQFCIASQHKLGGWRYTPRGDSDTSVTGWMVMALQSAKNAGIDVPDRTWRGIGSYLDIAAVGIVKDPEIALQPEPMLGSRYSYQPGTAHDPVMTAEALLCRIHCGWPQTDPRLHAGCYWLLKEWFPEWEDRDVYYWYYATQTLFHMQGEYWARWNTALRELLVVNQVKQGAELGSWNPLGVGDDREIGADLWSASNAGGRLYVTCFSLCILEAYYRNLPYYSDVKKQEEAKRPRL